MNNSLPPEISLSDEQREFSAQELQAYLDHWVQIWLVDGASGETPELTGEFCLNLGQCSGDYCIQIYKKDPTLGTFTQSGRGIQRAAIRKIGAIPRPNF